METEQQTRVHDNRNRPKEIKWSAPEYVFKKKSVDWYWGFALFVLLLMGIAIYARNFLFAIIILIASFTMVLYTVRPPRTLEYVVSQRGIKTDQKTYPYQTINCFYINESRENDKEALLLIKLKKITEPLLVIPLGDAPLDELQDFLLDFVEEQEIARPAGQVFMEIFGF